VKWWHAVLGIIGIVVVSAFVVPPNIRCKFIFWDKNACASVQQGVSVLNKLGYSIDPNKPIIFEPGYGQAIEDVYQGLSQ